jgi:hypothetical protein
MFDNAVKGGTDPVCREIIKEFDGDFDGVLGFDEFLNAFLPAANESLRNFCLFHKRGIPKYSSLVEQIACRILELEADMAA